ncbi:uncharacterized protein [Typha latifolia]|uniref:uncharacterized protein n=1 Tax=Typha latifolia TaxID=4733 RepID=UPI003C2B35DC
MERREFRRSMTLSNQLSSVNSSNLRDLLKVRDDDDNDDGGETLDPAIPGDKPVSEGGRTLLDIIREEQNAVAAGGANITNWRSFKDRLRLRRAGAAFTTSATPISDPDLISSVHSNPNPNPNPTRNRLLPHSLSIRPASDEVTPLPGFPAAPVVGDESSPASEAEEQPVRVSLMALLEQTDRQWSSGGIGDDDEFAADATAETSAAAAEEEEEGGEEEEEDTGAGGGMYHVCCVCMVRHKGAAFIPCGHTFCRLCSRELWVSRGNCPLCNGFILEILDIF